MRQIQFSDSMSEKVTGAIFVLPAVVSLLTFIIGPILYSFYISFFHFSFLNPSEAKFVGIHNYIALFSDPTFLRALRNTTFYSLGVVPTQTVIALLLALIIDQKIKGQTFFRVSYFLPTVTSIVAVAVIFIFLFKNDGLLNQLLHLIGFQGADWFNNPTFALPAIMSMAVWTTVGQFMMIYLSGLQEIPDEIYEAGAIDGASGIQRFRFITVPMLKRTTFFVVVMSLIGTFQVFDQAYIISGGEGGPLNSTMTVVLYLFRTAFKDMNMGYASAMAFILFIIIFVITLLQKRLFEEEAS